MTMITISAGKFESGEDGQCTENIKFCDESHSVLSSLALVKEKHLMAYHFCYLERNGVKKDAAEVLNEIEKLL